MDTITYRELLLTSAFCCMAADGHIDDREIAIIKSMCEKSPFFKDFNFQDEINQLVLRINTKGKKFIQDYFELLNKSELSEQEELTLIDFAIQTIKADEQVEYSEIKLFKNIRYILKSSDETILKAYPDIDNFLKKDIIAESSLDKITRQYLEEAELPHFDLVSIASSSLDKSDKK